MKLALGEPRRAIFNVDSAIKAASTPGVAGAAVAADGDAGQQRILIAIDAQLDDGLKLAGRVALAPERLAGA